MGTDFLVTSGGAVALVTGAASGSIVWTTFTESVDTQKVYVDASRPDDTGDGLSEGAAKKTLEAGYGVLRDGYPDWLLLKRGETWDVGDSVDGLGVDVGGPYWWQKSGRSVSEMMLVGSYGSGDRPKLTVPESAAASTAVLKDQGGGEMLHVAFTDLDISCPYRNPDDPAFSSGVDGPAGMDFSYVSDILIENCRLSWMRTGINVRSLSGQDPPNDTRDNFRVRGCVIVDNYPIASHGQGMFGNYVTNLVVESCAFIHNGWNDTEHAATIYNRNIYLAHSAGAVIRDTINARGSSGQFQMREGGTVEYTLNIENPRSISFGHPENNAGTFTGTCRYNVIIGSESWGTVVGGSGIIVGADMDGVDVYGNVICHNRASGTTYDGAFVLNKDESGADTNDVQIYDNIVYKWDAHSSVALNLQGQAGQPTITSSTFHDNEISMESNRIVSSTQGDIPAGFVWSNNTHYTTRTAADWYTVNGTSYSFSGWETLVSETGSTDTQATYSDPERDIESYMTSIGGTATIDAFLAAARLQERGSWSSNYEARTVINYIRAGFDLGAV